MSARTCEGSKLPAFFMLAVSSAAIAACGTTNADIDLEHNKQIIREMNEEVWNAGNLDAVDAFFSPSFVLHFLPDGSETRGTEGLREHVRDLHAAFPDWSEDIEHIVAEQDLVVIHYLSSGTNQGHWLGEPPTGNRVEVNEMSIFRIEEGRIAEQWLLPDIGSMRQQLAGARVDRSGVDGLPAPSPDEDPGFTYRREHRVDLTADGTPEMLVLSAAGRIPDDVVVEFTIRGGDAELFTASWLGAGYFVYDVPSDSTPREERFTRIRRRLDEFFDPVAFAPLDPGSPRFAADADGEPVALISSAMVQPHVIDSLVAVGADSATAHAAAWDATWGTGFIHPDARRFWQSMVQARPLTFQFFSGGEYNRQIAWSPEARRFFSVWECC